MATIDNNTGWLQIRLRIAQSTDDEALILDICFCNVSDKSQSLEFSNRSSKAERLGLHIFDQTGQRIWPKLERIVLLNNSQVDKHEICPKGEWIYKLIGRVQSGLLEYNGAVYEIASVQQMLLWFEYKGVKSNSVSVQMPLNGNLKEI